MSHLVIADGHYTGVAGEADRLSQLLSQVDGLEELSILGDLLELWIGLAGLETEWQKQLFAPLFELRAQGVFLRYLMGNKDYHIDAWNERHGLFDEVLAESTVVDSPQGPLHLAHGDLVNHRDRQYRRWRRLSHSAPFSLAFRAMPRRWLAGLSDRVATGMERTNREHKSYFPENELRARARELPPGRATLIYGHFHLHRELEEGDKRIITLPFLGDDNAGILIDERGFARIEAPTNSVGAGA